MEGFIPESITEPSWHSASFYRCEGTDLRCTLCPHGCLLREGDVGLCRVRRRRGVEMETATFSAAVVHVDNVERKPLYHFAPGRRVLTIAPPGCSLSCNYCQNFRISQIGRVPALPWVGAQVDPSELVARADDDDAILGFSYSEPSLAIELTLAIAELTARPLVWKTNGYMTPEAVEAVAPHLAAVNVDLKAPDDARSRSLTGGALGPVIDTIGRFVRAGVWVEVSTPLIPDFNADAESVKRMAAIVCRAGAHVPWHLLRFIPEFRMREMRPTRPDELAMASAVGSAAGLRHVYVERALGADGRNTACPGCRRDVVTRDIWKLRENLLVDGACPDCGTRIEGRWETN